MAPTLSKDKKALLQKVGAWTSKKFGGSGDLDARDAVHVIDWMDATFGAETGALKAIFEGFRLRLEALDPAWAQSVKACITRVPKRPASGSPVEVFAEPCLLGWRESDSLKDRSKMNFILQSSVDLLERPYDSMTHPIEVTFAKAAAPGSPVGDFSIRTSIGFAKSLAMKINIIAAVELGLSDTELGAALPEFQSYYGFRCICKPGSSDWELRKAAMQDKMAEAARPRPDVLQMFNTFRLQAAEDGEPYSTACPRYMEELEGATTNINRHMSDMEKVIVGKTLPALTASGIREVEYHWNLIRPANSACPYWLLSAPVFTQGASPKSPDNKLWKTILQGQVGTPDGDLKRECVIRKRIGTFNYNRKDAARLGRKVHINNFVNCKPYQCKLGLEDLWEVAAVFAHFAPQWGSLLTREHMDDLWRRFCGGLLDQELLEKGRIQNPGLEVLHFRFLRSYAVAGAGDPASSIHSATGPSTEAQEIAEVKRMQKKADHDVQQWKVHQHALDLFMAKSHAERGVAVDERKRANRIAVEEEQALRFPIRKLDEISHVPMFIQSSIQRLLDVNGADKNLAYQIYWINCTVLGYDAPRQARVALELASAALAASPARSCILLAAPNVGKWGAEFMEDEITKAAQTIEDLLRDPNMRLMVRRLSLCFALGAVIPPTLCHCHHGCHWSAQFLS